MIRRGRRFVLPTDCGKRSLRLHWMLKTGSFGAGFLRSLCAVVPTFSGGRR